MADFGISFDQNKSVLERSIRKGRDPYFGYPLMSFGELKRAFDGMLYQDAAEHTEES